MTRPRLSTVATFLALLCIAWCLLAMFWGCRLANDLAFTMNKGMTPAVQPSAWLGSQQIMPVPIPQPVKEIDWVGIGGIVAVQLATYWLNHRKIGKAMRK